MTLSLATQVRTALKTVMRQGGAVPKDTQHCCTTKKWNEATDNKMDRDRGCQ